MPRCLYVTHGWGIHDERWMAALRTLGYEPTALKVYESLGNLHVIREMIRATTERRPDIPILAGPITPITKQIVDCSPHTVGLSWGFDLHGAQDLTWLSNLAGLIVDSTATANIAINAGMPAERITLLPWGVDVERFTPNGPTLGPEAWDLPGDSNLILSLRAHEPLYRVADVIAGFAEISESHPHAVLLIGHEGTRTAELHAQVSQLGITHRVRFIGKVSEDQLPNLLRSAAVYITASELDGTSVTLLQAMACTTPVLASDNPGNLDWVTSETGTCFRTGSSKSLAEGLAAILNEPAKAAQLALSARERVEKHANWAANIHRLDDALQAATS